MRWSDAASCGKWDVYKRQIQNLYDEARRENCMKNAGCEAELEKTKHELQETKKKLQIAEKKYDDLMKEIRNMFSFVKEKDSSDEGMTEEDDFPADNEEEDRCV